MDDSDLKIHETIKLIFNETILARAIVYVSAELAGPGEYEFGDIKMILPWYAHVLFIDLEPAANWGHKCIYLALQADGDERIEAKAQFPPSFGQAKTRFSLFQKGPDAPDWAVMTFKD